MADKQHDLDDIEQQISAQRVAYLHATWAADNEQLPPAERKAAEAAAHRAEGLVDKLLGQWDDVNRGTTTAHP